MMKRGSIGDGPPGRLIGGLFGFLMVAAPLASIAWHELSEVLSGRIERRPLFHGIGALIALAGASFLLARFFRAHDARP